MMDSRCRLLKRKPSFFSTKPNVEMEYGKATSSFNCFCHFFKENVSFLAKYSCTILLITPRSNSSNLLNSSFLFGLFFHGVLGPSLSCTNLLTVDKDDPVASAVRLNRE